MIPSRRSPIFTWWFARHARLRIEQTFGRVRVFGLADARRALERGSVLFVANHTSWWDALVILHASSHLLETEGYAMMDAKNLRKLPFFGLVGAFGVDRGDARDGARAIHHGAKLLTSAKRGSRAVWVFAQGREVPITVRPLGFEGGAAEIARVARRATVLPVGLRYEFGEAERPELYLSFGPAEELHRGRPGGGGSDVERLRASLERAVTRELDRIEDAVRGREVGFVDTFSRGEGWLQQLQARVLAALTRTPALGVGDSARG